MSARPHAEGKGSESISEGGGMCALPTWGGDAPYLRWPRSQKCLDVAHDVEKSHALPDAAVVNVRAGVDPDVKAAKPDLKLLENV